MPVALLEVPSGGSKCDKDLVFLIGLAFCLSLPACRSFQRNHTQKPQSKLHPHPRTGGTCQLGEGRCSDLVRRSVSSAGCVQSSLAWVTSGCFPVSLSHCLVQRRGQQAPYIGALLKSRSQPESEVWLYQIDSEGNYKENNGFSLEK